MGGREGRGEGQREGKGLRGRGGRLGKPGRSEWPKVKVIENKSA